MAEAKTARKEPKSCICCLCFPLQFSTCRSVLVSAKANQAPPAAEPVEDPEFDDEGMEDPMESLPAAVQRQVPTIKGSCFHLRTAARPCSEQMCGRCSWFACRRVMALRQVQEQYDATNRLYQKELAQLQAKYLQQYGEYFLARLWQPVDMVCLACFAILHAMFCNVILTWSYLLFGLQPPYLRSARPSSMGKRTLASLIFRMTMRVVSIGLSVSERS